MRRLTILLLGCVLALGCGGKEDMEEKNSLPQVAEVTVLSAEEAAPTATPVPTPTATPVPTATPEPTPTPLYVPRDENGNLIINEDLYNSFTQREFPLPSAPVVLIYHTHAEEAYRPVRGYEYEETVPNSFKTLDKTRSVVAMGEFLKEALEERGFIVIHDDTDVEPPDIRTAYDRSLEIMQKYPEATVFIDLHRNTANMKTKRDDVVWRENNTRCARLFFVVGVGIGTYEGEYDTHHDWQQNYALANAITENIRKVSHRFAFDVRLKVGRYNQHVSPYCMLIELGHNAITFEDARNTIPYLADAIAATLVFPKEEQP